jgi:hypothetical protein
LAKLDFAFARRKKFVWVIAVVVTLASLFYQRITGPTYPVRGTESIAGTEVSYKLYTTWEVGEDAPVSIEVPDQDVGGRIEFRRYKSHDEWTEKPMVREESRLVSRLPMQPPAGKLMYRVILESGSQTLTLTGDDPIILRYKGHVPDAVVYLHVLFIFVAFMLAIRTVFEALDAGGKSHRYMLWTVGVFFVAGLILGPIMQKYAFGELWTGVPLGHDLTDNKALIAMLGWIWAWSRNRGGRDGRGWIVFAGILMLVVYLIPHSVLGSELDYTQAGRPELTTE